MPANIRRIQAYELKKILEEEPYAQVIDVRENIEHAAEALKPSRNMPLSNLEKTFDKIDRAKPVYLLCRTGNRASQAAQKLSQQGFETVHVVEGGLEACKSQGLCIEKRAAAVWAMDRQVRFTAGSMILAGIILGAWVHPGFFALAVFVSAGLVYSAVTDTCGMAMLLAKMPWNRIKK
jgi:rhodanese-related sulfurtransferase